MESSKTIEKMQKQIDALLATVKKLEEDRDCFGGWLCENTDLLEHHEREIGLLTEIVVPICPDCKQKMREEAKLEDQPIKSIPNGK